MSSGLREIDRASPSYLPSTVAPSNLQSLPLIMTFWDHLDELRFVLIRCGAIVVVFAVVAFCFRDELFAIVLAPKEDTFCIYELFRRFTPLPAFHVDLINTALARQFILHIQMSASAGLIVASPYILYEAFRFIAPALYSNERRYFVPALIGAYAMFALGAAVSYFVIFPLTFRFLGTYQVSAEVTNMVSLDSYVSTLLSLTLALGLVFEMPVVCWILGRMGLLDRRMLRSVRRHAIVAILVAAAIITPTGDAFTLMLVSLPIWMLYEASIWLLPQEGDSLPASTISPRK